MMDAGRIGELASDAQRLRIAHFRPEQCGRIVFDTGLPGAGQGVLLIRERRNTGFGTEKANALAESLNEAIRPVLAAVAENLETEIRRLATEGQENG